MRKSLLALMVLMLSLRILTQSASANTDSPIPKVIINELMPNPDGSDTLYEWIELYNTTNSEIDLNNWKIDGAVITDAKILPKAYLMIAKNKDALLGIYPDIINILNSSISLLNSGETIELEDSEGNLIDSISYISSASGLSLERDGTLTIENCNNLQLHIDQHSIEKKNNSVKAECWPENYNWEVEVEIPPTTFSFLLSLDGENFATQISDIGDQEIFTEVKASDNSTFTILKIFDELGNTLTNPFAKDNYFGKILAELQKADGTIVEVSSEKIKIYPEILITEIYPSPASSENEWLELYNPTSFLTNLENWYLSEELDQDRNCIPTGLFPESTVIEANDYYVVENDLLKVSLNNGGDQIYLCNDVNQVISELTYPNTLTGEVYGLEYIDGIYSGIAELLASQTKAAQNSSIKVIEEEPEEEEEEPDEDDEVTEIPEIKSFEGVIIANYSSSFDIQTTTGVIRVGLKYLDNVSRKKGDSVKVSGEYILDGEIRRVFPKLPSDLIITHLVDEDVVTTDKAVNGTRSTPTTKATSIKQPEPSVESNEVANYEYKVPNISLIKQNNTDDIFHIANDSSLNSTLKIVLVMLFLIVAFVIIYICYVVQLDKKLIQLYNHWQKPNGNTYFKPRVNLANQKEY